HEADAPHPGLVGRLIQVDLRTEDEKLVDLYPGMFAADNQDVAVDLVRQVQHFPLDIDAPVLGTGRVLVHANAPLTANLLEIGLAPRAQDIAGDHASADVDWF